MHGRPSDGRDLPDLRCFRRAAARQLAVAGAGDVPLHQRLHGQGRGNRGGRQGAVGHVLALLRRAVPGVASEQVRRAARGEDAAAQGPRLADQHGLERRPHGVGKRIKLAHTRAIIDAIHSGALASAKTKRDPRLRVRGRHGMPRRVLGNPVAARHLVGQGGVRRGGQEAGRAVHGELQEVRSGASAEVRRALAQPRDAGVEHMDWLFDLYRTNPTAQAIAILALVCTGGMALGSIKVRGIGLGTAGVLFAGILVGYFSKPVDHKTFEFIKEFGLILFVFCIGLQLGPGFFASLRKWACGSMCWPPQSSCSARFSRLLGWLLGIDYAAVLGMFSGATTNTPSLGAAQQTLAAMPGVSAERATLPALAYAVSYPMAIIGIIATMLILKRSSASTRPARRGVRGRARKSVEPLERRTLVIDNPELEGKTPA